MQEALQNVSAHARAHRAEVTIGFAPEAITLTVADDGEGFDLDAVQRDGQGHFGLLGMQERAGSLGGRLTIQTELGRWTRVAVWVPMYPLTGAFPVPLGLAVDEARATG
jgi:two-component system NarL family sensor kinase